MNNVVALNKYIGEALLWMILMTCFGFEIQMAIPGILRMESTPVNFGFRLLYVFVSLIIIIFGISQNKNVRRSYSVYAILIFWIFYSLRLFYDIEIRGIYFMKAKTMMVYQFAFGATLLPSLAVFAGARHINLKNIEMKLFFVLFLGNFLTTYLLAARYGSLSLDLFNKVTMTGFENEDGSISASLNYIAITLYGLMLSSAAMYNLFILKKKRYRITKACLWLGLVLGFANLFIGASRGVTLILFLVVVPFLASVYLKTRRLTFAWLSRYLLIISLSVIAVLMAVLPIVLSEGVLVVKRIQLTLQNLNSGKGDGRLTMYKSAISQFLNHPVIGDRYVCVVNGNHTAHNFFLEIPMSLGLVGILLFSIILTGLFSFIRSKFCILSPLGVFALMLLIWLFSSLTSGSIWGWSAIWILLTLILSYPKERIMNFHTANFE